MFYIHRHVFAHYTAMNQTKIIAPMSTEVWAFSFFHLSQMILVILYHWFIIDLISGSSWKMSASVQYDRICLHGKFTLNLLCYFVIVEKKKYCMSNHNAGITRLCTLTCFLSKNPPSKQQHKKSSICKLYFC